METPDYLEYKRNKEQFEVQPVKKKTKKVFKFFWLFIFLFVGFFILIYNYGSNYFSKVDVEYEKNLNLEKEDEDFEPLEENEEKYYLDKRLIAIYNEEMAPSKAKIVNKDNKEPKVIEEKEYQELTKKEDKKEKEEEANTKTHQMLRENIKLQDTQANSQTSKDVPTYIRVLVGKYATVQEAKAAQEKLNNLDSIVGITPFIRKIGSIYTIQVGSYTNKDMAKKITAKLMLANFSVWTVEN